MAPTSATAPLPPTSSPPPPPPPFGPDTRRLRRSSSDRYIGGVAGGVGEFAGVDPNVIRIALMVLSIVSLGFLLVAYLAAWVLLPDEEDDEAPGLRWYRRHAPGPDRPVATAGLLVLGAAAAAAAWSIAWGWQSGSFPAFLVIGLLGLAVISHRNQQHRSDIGGDDGDDGAGGRDVPPPDPAGPDDDPTDIEPWSGAITTVDTRPHPPTTSTASSPPPSAPPRPQARTRVPDDPEAAARRRRHGLVRNGVVLGAAGAGTATAALWATETGSVAGWVVPAVVGVVLLAGLATTPIWGWSWTVAALAVLVVPFLLLAAVPGVSLRGGFGTRHDRPGAVADLRDRYQLGIGHQDLDLAALDLSPGSTTVVHLSTGIGRTEVRVPDSVDLELRGRLGGGTVYVDDEPAGVGGTDVAFHRTYRATRRPVASDTSGGSPSGIDAVDPPTLVLDTTTGIGSLEVTRVP